MSESALIITDRSLSAAIGAWAEDRSARGKDFQDSLRKVMKAWVFAAYDLVKPGDKAKIQRDLMKIITGYSRIKPGKRHRASKAADEMRGTLAARLVWLLDWKGARGAKAGAFYRLAKKFLNARVFSANIHRAGFFATFDLVHGRPAGTSGPRYKKSPVGDSSESVLDDAAEIISENFASAHNGIGITGLAGSAFESTLPNVIKIFRRYAMEAELARAQKRGVPLVFDAA